MKNATLSLKKSINEVAQVLESKGFDCYLSTKSLKHDSRNVFHDVYTCTKGAFDGEVVDIHYDFNNGIIHDLSCSSQFHTQSGGDYLTTPKILNFI
jgi:hypothetical protein